MLVMVLSVEALVFWGEDHPGMINSGDSGRMDSYFTDDLGPEASTIHFN